MTRPVDALQFALALKANGAPNSVFAKHIETVVKKYDNSSTTTETNAEAGPRHTFAQVSKQNSSQRPRKQPNASRKPKWIKL